VPHPHAYTSHIDVKYGKRSPLRMLPFFRDNCNGFFSHHQLKFEKRYFRNGSKKLIFDIQLGNGMSLLMVHFALRRDVRKLQCRELKKMLEGRKNVIVCGDFNIFRGTRELHTLAESCGLKIVNAHQPTFPAIRPKKALDLFLCPKDLHHVSAEVINDVQVSDHLPVMLEIA
jgi:endonuclease/exonuclease/phosphatase family metal-dependent hydrolase